MSFRQCDNRVMPLALFGRGEERAFEALPGTGPRAHRMPSVWCERNDHDLGTVEMLATTRPAVFGHVDDDESRRGSIVPGALRVGYLAGP